MSPELLQKIQRTVFGGALIVSGSWIISKILGLLKQRLIFTTFGPGGADSVYAAFAIPDLIYGTLVLGSLLSAFMPVFMATWQRDQQEAWGISRSVMKILAVVFFICGVIILLAAPLLVGILVGPNMDPSDQHTTIVLMRLLSMNMLLFAVSNVLAGVLQSFKRFLAVSLAPIAYNAGIVASIMLFGRSLGPVSVAYGAIGGAMLHVAMQAVAAWQAGWRFGPSLSWRHSGVLRIGRLLLPRTVGQSITQLAQFVNVPIATRLGQGQLAIFRMANDIQDAPTNIVGLSMATVAFPTFVELLSSNRRAEFIQHFSKIVRQVLFLIIPLTVLIIQLRAQIVRVLYGAPNVSWEVTIDTAQTLGYFALSFVAQSLIPILARSFYAMQDTRTPVRITIGAVGLGIVGSVWLGFAMGVEGLALSYSISSFLNAAALLVILHHRLGNLDDTTILNAVFRITGVTILMALTVQFSKVAVESLGVSLQYGYGVLVQGLVAGLVGVLSYIIFSMLFKVEEVGAVAAGVRRVLGALRNGRNGGRNGAS